MEHGGHPDHGLEGRVVGIDARDRRAPLNQRVLIRILEWVAAEGARPGAEDGAGSDSVEVRLNALGHLDSGDPDVPLLHNLQRQIQLAHRRARLGVPLRVRPHSDRRRGRAAVGGGREHHLEVRRVGGGRGLEGGGYSAGESLGGEVQWALGPSETHHAERDGGGLAAHHPNCVEDGVFVAQLRSRKSEVGHERPVWHLELDVVDLVGRDRPLRLHGEPEQRRVGLGDLEHRRRPRRAGGHRGLVLNGPGGVEPDLTLTLLEPRTCTTIRRDGAVSIASSSSAKQTSAVQGA